LYAFIKLIHIFGACILLGTGGGIAFFMLQAYLSRDKPTFVAVSRMVVLADWVFTAPAVVVQFASGLWLTHRLGIPFGSRWFVAVAGLFVFVGLCWLPVVWIQHRLADLAKDAHGDPLYRRLMRIWIVLGVPAFLAVVLIIYLMVTKAGVAVPLFA
jgi:uncharacterized membrane protein